MPTKKYVEAQNDAPLSSPYKGIGLQKFEGMDLMTSIRDKIQVVDVVDEWDASDEGRLVYEVTNNRMLFATDTKWMTVLTV